MEEVGGWTFQWGKNLEFSEFVANDDPELYTKWGKYMSGTPTHPQPTDPPTNNNTIIVLGVLALVLINVS